MSQSPRRAETESVPTAPSSVVRYADADVPTAYGLLRFIVFREVADPSAEHIAIVKGDPSGASRLHVRVHSECMTGEVFHSLKCDCRQQLEHALEHIAARDVGVVVYLRQEGRGIGLGNKIRAYALQQEGRDTVDANRELGFADDLRRYGVAADMLGALDVRSVVLLTNNPAKVEGLREHGVDVVGREASETPVNPHNRDYLRTKRARMGHLLDDLEGLFDAQ